VNGAARVELTPGTPLVLEVSLGSGPRDPARSVGSRLRPWHALIRLVAADGGAPPWRVERMGEPRSLAVLPDAENRLQVGAETGPVARLEAGRRVHTVGFAAGPEATAALPPGEYRLRAVVETPFWLRWGWHGRAVSGEVVVAVRDPTQAFPRRAVLEAERAARSAGYHVRAGRGDDALRSAQELLALEPERARSHAVLGDALAISERRPEALAAYRRALALLPPSYEEPVGLVRRIEELARGGGGSAP
jgi:hypothetical protein